MNFREAKVSDIPRIQVIRHLVRENRLSDPLLVTDKDCEEYICQRGKGWVGETEGRIIGFGIADLREHSIWALFVQPEYESKGVGKHLQRIMLDWYFNETSISVWLTTAKNTRAELFYRKSGWKEVGIKPNGEIKFEMTKEVWDRIG